MPKQLTVTAYSFAELNDKAKDKARQWMREGLDYDWWEGIYEDARILGIKITGFDLGRANDITGTVDDTEATAHKIIKNHGEGCETHNTASTYLKDREEVIELHTATDERTGEVTNQDEVDARLDDLGADFARFILMDYLKMLRDEYTYRMSDEAIDEDIEANDYLFTAEGSRTTVLND